MSHIRMPTYSLRTRFRVVLYVLQPIIRYMKKQVWTVSTLPFIRAGVAITQGMTRYLACKGVKRPSGR